MGSGRWSSSDWDAYSRTHIAGKKSTSGYDGIYSASSLHKDLNPKGVIRESRDSADNPNATPIMVFLDVTGSMSMVLDAMARTGLPTLATEIYNRKPVADPHILFGGIGDPYYDDAPLQVTQFEADIRIAEQLTKIWLEKGGGGNDFEGYALAWYFGAFKTSTDHFEKRGKKGYLFTVGDERPTPELTKGQILEVFGDEVQANMSAEQLLSAVTRQYEVFHIVVKEGSGWRHDSKEVERQWRELLGQRVIFLDDHTKMGEVIVSTLQVMNGEDKAKVAASWDGSTSIVVAKALDSLTPIQQDPNTGIRRF